MKIAYILFDNITTLDFVGIYDPISRIKSGDYLPTLDWDLCSNKASIKDNFGLELKMDLVYPDLSKYEMIIIPGGFGTRSLHYDKTFIQWLQSAKNATYKVSICTGSLLLGAAGFLKEKSATCHFNEYETLAPYCQNVIKSRIVDDHNIITSGAVSSSLDLGLYLCAKLIGPVSTEAIRKRMNYLPSHHEVTVVE